MADDSRSSPPPGGQFLVYQTEDGKLKLDVRFEGETVWLTQQHLAALFQTSVPNISMHIRNVFAEGELPAGSVVKESLTTAADGKKYATKFFNLDVIISVGYRVKSLRGTQFRIWATQRLREYIVKGFVLDDECLQYPDQPFDSEPELAALNNLVEESKPNWNTTSSRRSPTFSRARWMLPLSRR